MPSASPSAGRQGPLRVAIAILVLGLLAVWLVKPIGNPCPDLDRLPQGSSARSSPSFSPPLTRTCTYTAAIGIEARARYVPWIDWIVIVLLAAAAGAVAHVVSPATRSRGPSRPREPGERPAPAAQEPRERRSDVGDRGERDEAERARARGERAERARRGR